MRCHQKSPKYRVLDEQFVKLGLAFLIDQVLEMACPIMKRIFAKCYIRTATWERLRTSLCAVAFRNRQELYGHALGIYTAYLPTTRPDGRPPPPAR